MATLEEHLNTLSLKQIKNLVREHNLLSKIKLGQPKEALIAQLLEHFEELVDDDMVSSIYKIKVPKETDVVPKKGQKRIALERPAITQQQINPGEAVLRQMIEPKRKTGALVSNNDKGLQEAVRIPEERVDEPEEAEVGEEQYMTDAEYDAEAKKLKEEISDLLDKSSLKDIMKVIDTYEYNAFTAKSKSAVIKFILYNFDGVEKADKFLERWDKTLGITGKGKLGRDGHGQRKILHGEEIHGKGEKWDKFKKIAIPILATAAAVGAAYAGHRAYQNNNRVVTYKGYNPDSHWTPGSYREVLRSEPRSLARIDSGLPNPPRIRYPPTAPPLPPPLTVIPYTRALTRQPRIDLKAVLKAQKTGNVSGLTPFQLERYARLNK
jgi:hypothetical protein